MQGLPFYLVILCILAARLCLVGRTGPSRASEALTQNLVSYHLQRLRKPHLVSERRSSADRRDVHYSLNLERLSQLYRASGEALHPALTGSVAEPQTHLSSGKAKPVRVLFLCTHNSTRSQMAEGLARHLSQGRIEAFSAGNEPRGLHPYAARAMAELGIDISQQRSKHLDEFLNQSFDYIITVCDRVRESCPIFPGDPKQIHWSFADPAQVAEPGRYRAFERTAAEMLTRIRYLLLMIERSEESGL
jgi:ArsR family transcriptional regulator, arsenate/arsenite/antimonite-responsive transcriptional repressor / arsenate reductase (thioredoxin)